MKSYIASGLLASMAATRALAQDCTNSLDSVGNHYKCAVQAMTFDNIKYSGTYDQITSMDPNTGVCGRVPVPYSGAMAPLDEEVFLHFRGPVQIKQFAFYSTGSSAPAKKVRRDSSAHHHKRGRNAHKHKRAPQADWVTATIDGIVQSWTNNYHPGAPATEAPAEAPTSFVANFKPQIKMVNPTASSYIRSAVTSDQAYVDQPTSAAVAEQPSATTIPSLPSPSSGSGSGSGGSGSWQLQGYYNAEQQQAQGITFFNNNGGQGSGVWSHMWGNSMSFSDPSGVAGSSKPTILNNGVTIPSSKEIIITTNQPCNGACPLSRSEDVAYKGFEGSQKAFFFEFSMPHTSEGNDMPAIWMLNAQIPRTLQYNASCSCWNTGCGEFDIFETLAAGEERCTTTLHAGVNNQRGIGADNYFKRPTTWSQKAVVLMNDDKIHVQYLDDSVQWGAAVETMAEDVISGMCGTIGSSYTAPSS